MTRRILIVEDEDTIAELLDINMTRRGFTVMVAPTGREAISIAEKHPPDIVLLDILLPDISGWEVCTKLRSMPATRTIPIIILSAAVQKEDRKKAEIHSTRFISKPFEIPQLLEAINQLLG